MDPQVVPFFHAATGTWSYLVVDAATRATAIVDPVLDFDLKSGRTATLLATAMLAHVHEHRLRVDWVLETHTHADHLSAGAWLRDSLRAEGAPAQLAIGAGVLASQQHFRAVFNLDDLATDGSQFDRLVADGERLQIGGLAITVLATPGHTRDAVSYLVGDAVFVGDTLFAPDVGTARCDFPGGDAETLHASIRMLLSLPPETRVFLCHDYPPAGREPRAQTTVAEQLERNVHLAGRDAAQYAELRRARDATLPLPQLIVPALQFNLRGGRPPPPERNGVSYLKLPLDAL